jgi:protein TonB
MPSRRFLAALAASILLHGLTLAGASRFLRQPGPAPDPMLAAVLTATLLPPAEITPDDSPLLKNTLTEGRATHSPSPLPGRAKSPAQDAQRKLAEHVYYPPEAIAQGLEGEVRVLLSLDGEGHILDVQVASGSGHAILDQAAVRAAYAAGSLGGTGRREVLLPVVFRLRH